MEPYWFVPRSEEMAAGGGMPTCMYLLGVMGAVVLALAAALVKLAKMAWDERMGRMTDKNEMDSELRAMLKATNEKRGGS